jgi:polar amino acid transport system substrate-binding protein
VPLKSSAARLIEYPSSGVTIEAATSRAWDVSFTPVDAERKTVVDFGPNYFLGESTYMVLDGSTITSIEEVDWEGVRVNQNHPLGGSSALFVR